MSRRLRRRAKKRAQKKALLFCSVCVTIGLHSSKGTETYEQTNSTRFPQIDERI